MSLDGFGLRATAFSGICMLAALLLAMEAYDANAEAPPGEVVTVLAAGDIAQCGSNFNESAAAKVAQIVMNIPEAIVLMLGDMDYSEPDDFENSCYGKTWGKFKDRTRPAAGNHDYQRHDGSVDHFLSRYAKYWGEGAVTENRAYGTFGLGAWRVIFLDSELLVHGDKLRIENKEQRGKAQLTWFKNELARANHASCTLVFFHHPRFSSSRNRERDSLMEEWQAMYDNKVDIVLNGHDHVYERFQPQNALGISDAHGPAEFVVGTGGATHYEWDVRAQNSAFPSYQDKVGANAIEHGILRLNLAPGEYSWEFLTINGTSSDKSINAVNCHNK